MGHRIKPFVDGACHLGLAAGERLAHGIDAAGSLVLQLEHFGQAVFEFVGANSLRHCELSATPPRPCDHDGNDQKQQQRDGTEADQRDIGSNRQVADRKKDLVHAALVADSPPNANEEGTFMVNRGFIFMVNVGSRFVVNETSTGDGCALTPANQQLKSPAKHFEKPWPSEKSSSCRTRSCGWFPNPSRRSRRRCASSPMICSRPCTTRPESASRRSRSHSRCG